MSALNLVFGRPAYAGGPLDLVFGSEDGAPPALPLTVTITVTLSAPVVTCSVVYDNRLPPLVSAAVSAPHQVAASADAAPSAPWARPGAVDSAPPATWQSAGTTDAAPRTPWARTEPRGNAPATRWGAARVISEALAAVYQQCHPLGQGAAARWQTAAEQSVNVFSPHQVANAAERVHAARMQQAQTAVVAIYAPHQVADQAARALRVRWQEARHLPTGLTVWVPEGGGGLTPHVPDLNLVFACPAYVQGEPVHLVFGHVCGAPVGPSAPLYILPARYYMAVHSLTAHRMPDMQPVRIFGVTMRAGKGSYGWTFNVSATRAAFDQLAPVGTERAQLLIELDGLQFSGIVMNRMFDEAFGGRGCSITVQSRTALLAGPKALVTQRVGLFDRTAQQLALEALDLTGFALGWGLSDWLVPAGAWSHSGTPLNAVQTIVEAAGGYLQSHRTAATLLARHPYRDLPLAGGGTMVGAPWNWNHIDVVPDVELPPGVLTRLGVEEDDGPDVNGVYLQGTNWGNWALYKRLGTAADKLASPVTDALLTADEAHRQRGRSIVGQAGRKQLHTCEMPVITSGVSAPGILEDNQLIQINESTPWRGMVRDVSVSAPVNGEVRQTFVIERHLASV